MAARRVCAPDVGTPLCAAGWLIFITTHNDEGAREWGLGWKRHRETKERRAARRGSEGKGKEGPKKKSVEQKKKGGDKGDSEAEKLCFLLERSARERWEVGGTFGTPVTSTKSATVATQEPQWLVARSVIRGILNWE